MDEDSPRETGQEQQDAAITEVREITPEVVEIAEIVLGKIKNEKKMIGPDNIPL